ncbi:hypothetical protein [Mucilaginibacter antarcticus]|uniref:hypothetical protein n=1 Tax=Mucilaginibacter antarcticus TaxID=1855725 RepID=UPI003630DD9E
MLKITELVNIFDKEKREEEVEKLIGSAAKADHIASRTLKAINVKMNEDPVFFKRLSQLIRETIDAYHQQRITEAEYLARAKEYEDNFLNGKKDNVPTAVSGNDTLTAFYNLATEELKDALETKANWIDIAAEIALAIDTAIKENAFDQDRPVVDWMNNLDIEGRIKISIDDLLFDIKSKYDLNLDFDQIDHMVTDSIKVAKIKYKG